MTLGSITQSVWEAIGEPSDLNPASVGVTRLRDAINDAQDAVAMWIDNKGRKIYFREFEDTVRFTTLFLSGTLGTQVSLASLTLPNTIAVVAGRYTGWIVRVGAETRRVVSSTVAGGLNVLGLGAPLTADASGKTVDLAKVTYNMTGVDAISLEGVRVMEIQRIFDPSAGELEQAASRDYLYTPQMGTPSQWRHTRQGLTFDVAPDAARTYEMHVVRLPTTMMQQTDVLELPDTFCQAVELRAVWWGFRRMQDFNAAYATKREFEELMMRMATAATLNDAPDYFTVRSR